MRQNIKHTEVKNINSKRKNEHIFAKEICVHNIYTRRKTCRQKNYHTIIFSQRKYFNSK